MEALLLLFPLIFMLGMMLFAIAAMGFWIWMLVDCLQNNSQKDDEKLVWVLVIIFTHFIGALIYYFVQRPKRPVAPSLPSERRE